MEEYQLPQITIGARKKGKQYLGDLSNVMIWVRYNTYAQHRHTQCKQGQKNQEYQSKKQRKTRRIIGIFQVELTKGFS